MDEIRSIIEPIKKKWVYHFIVSPKTNNIEKSEWYLNQTLKWIHSHMDTVEAKAKLRLGKKSPDVRPMFILCMVEFARMRLIKDLKQLTDDDIEENSHSKAILIHTFNEVIQFSKIIHQLLGDKYYELSRDHDLLRVFHDLRFLDGVILDEEWESATKNFKDITDSSAWDPVLDGNFVDTYKIPRCVDRLLLLIRSLSDRIDCFLIEDYQMNLIELQCFLFEKLLRFLDESVSSPSPISKNVLSDMLFFKDDDSTIDVSRISRVLNGVNFVRLVLKDRYFISKRVADKIPPALSTKVSELAQDYKKVFFKLVDRVVAISEYFENDLDGFIDFIKPKLAENAFEIILDDMNRMHQRRKTKTLLGGLSSS